MTPLSYEVTWLLTPEQCLYSGSKMLSGLCDLERAGFLSLRLSTRIPFTEPIGSPICLEVCSAADGRRRKIVLDLHDSGAWFFSNSLAFADVYFKRGFVPSEVSKLPADARAKVVPLGLNYSCLSHGARRTLVAIARKNVLRGLLRSPRRRFRKLVEDLKHLKGLPQPEAFEQDPTAPREPTVLFQTRVWPDEGTATDYFSQVNVERVALVRALRAALGDRFRGGVMADAFAREYCPTQLAESDIHRSAYAQLIRKTTVAVYTRISQQAYELLRGQAAASEIADWNAVRAGGPDSELVFEATQGVPLDTVKVPGFYTYAGFRRLFIDRLPGIADKLKGDRWVLGAAGAQSAVEDQYKTLSDDLLALYGKDFVAAWRDALGRLKLKRLLADKPKYVTLAAASAPTSPIKQLIESVRDETALTRERPGFEKKGEKDPNAALFPNRAVPGADIEQTFKAFHVLVEGEPTRQPIDLIISNLADIYQSLLLMGNPAQAALATAQLQTQVAALRANANRLPAPFAAMLQTAATDVDADLTNSARSQLDRALRDTVTGVCQQVVSNRYPFARTDREVPLVDFGRLFGPQGIIDKFFTNQLAQYVDTSKQAWSWRQDNAIARALSSATGSLKSFQQAAQIRDTFFASGGLLPSMTLTITPPPAPIPPAPLAPPPAVPGATPAPPPPPAPSVGIKMDMNGTPIISPVGASAPVVAQWPGAGANRSAITVTSDTAGALPSTIERTGPWSLFRLIEAGAPVVRGDKIIVSYIVGGRELQYQISAGSTQNPFTLPALREFHCPSDL